MWSNATVILDVLSAKLLAWDSQIPVPDIVLLIQTAIDIFGQGYQYTYVSSSGRNAGQEGEKQWGSCTSCTKLELL